MKSPAFQFYPNDWLNDLALQACRLRARGLWHEMLCYMHQGVPYGHLTTPAGPISEPDLARKVREPRSVVRHALEELERHGVLSRTEAGVIYSRRMVRDHAIREARAAGGSLSIGHPKTHPPRVGGRVPFETPIDPPPSSSTPTSASKKHPETTGALSVPSPNGQPDDSERISLAQYLAGRIGRPV